MSQQKTNPDIAVIGMACRFPGAKNYDEFWENLKNGVHSITEIPPERWDTKKYYSPDIGALNKSIGKSAGLVDDFDQFDNQFFDISSLEAAQMDPQQRLLLEEAWHCIEDSGISLKTLQEKKTSVYVGVATSDYLQNASRPDVIIDNYTIASGNYHYALANRISHVFGFDGPSLSINTGCSASLYAILNAMQLISQRLTDFAIVGGVNIICHPLHNVSLSKAHVLSPGSECRTFDKDADGIIRGEGVGVVLLQALPEALHQQNRIYGVIKGGAFNHGSHPLSMTAPSVEAQRQVVSSAYRDAAVSPETVSYIEAHGTGTFLGDAIEVESLTRAFQEYTEKKRFCKIGSVKANIGHLEAGSGVAGVIKILLMMQHKMIPPTIHLKTINPTINFEASPFDVATELAQWKNSGNQRPLRAGVSTFGIGGANAHIVIEQAPEKPDLSQDHSDASFFLLSAKSKESLNALLKQWKDFIRTPKYESYKYSDIGKTLAMGRRHFSNRTGCLVRSKKDIEAFLRQPNPISSHHQDEQIFLCVSDIPLKGFSDIESFIHKYPVFSQQLNSTLNHMDNKIKSGFHEKIRHVKRKALNAFTAGYAYYNTLNKLGITPHTVTGCRQGLWLSLVISEMMTFQDAISVLNGDKKAHQIQLSRPGIAYYDPVSKKILKPYRFDESDIHRLIQGLDIHRESMDHYIDKARLLMENQLTFKKLIREWDEVLRHHHIDIFSMIKASENDDATASNQKILRLIVIVYALFKLNGKWDIRDHHRLADERFYEITDLVIAEVLPKEMIAELFLSDQPDIALMAETLNQRQERFHETQNEFAVLKNHQTFNEISDFSEWMHSAEKIETARPSGHYLYIQLGKNIRPIDNAIEFDDGSASSFEQSVLESWLRGIDIDWRRLYPEENFQKTPLPVYPFLGERFRLPKFELKPEDDDDKYEPVDDEDRKFSATDMDENETPDVPATVEASRGETVQKLEKYIEEQISKLINIPVDQLDKDEDIDLDSIKLTEFANRLNQEFRLELPPALFFEYPTIRRLSRYLVDAHHDKPADKFQLPERSQGPGRTLEDFPQSHTPERIIPLSEGQKGLWALHKMTPNMSAYNLPLCFHIPVDIDPQRFERACLFLLERHPILTSVIEEENGEPFLKTTPGQALDFKNEDISHLGPEEIIPYIRKKAKKPFDLKKGPLLRIRLFSGSRKEHFVLFCIHHVVFDGGSVPHLLETVFGAYRDLISGKRPEFLPGDVKYGEFVRMEEQMLDSEEGKKRFSYWKAQLSGDLPALHLPADTPRSRAKHVEGETLIRVIPPELSQTIKAFAKTRKTYLSMVFLGIYKLLLHRYTGDKDIIVGTVTNQRPAEGFDGQIGFFINMLPIRSYFSEDDTFPTFLETVQNTYFKGLTHSRPFPVLVRELKIPYTMEEPPVFQTSFAYQDSILTGNITQVEALRALCATLVDDICQEGEYEICLEVFAGETDFTLHLKYNPDLFSASTVSRMADHYVTLLRKIVHDPNQPLAKYPLLSENELKTLLIDWNRTDVDYPRDKCIHELFELQAAQTPDKPATVFEDESLTYRELDEKSGILGRYLQTKGVKPDKLVGLCVNRSLDMIVGLLGILKAGGAYVPLDPEFPTDRLEYMVENSDVSLILTQRELAEKVSKLGENARGLCLDDEWEKIEEGAKTQQTLKREVRPHHLVYVIYTSGSTGKPKGVMIPHQALTNFLVTMGEKPGLTSEDRLLAVTTYSFDIAWLELYLPLIKGALCCICPAEKAKDPERLKQEIERLKPTILQATPVTFTMLFHVGWENQEKTKILCGGEALTEKLKSRFLVAFRRKYRIHRPNGSSGQDPRISYRIRRDRESSAHPSPGSGMCGRRQRDPRE